MSSQPQWLTAHTQFATVYYQQDDTLASQDLVANLEPLVRRVRDDLRLESVPYFKVIVAPDRAEYLRLSGRESMPEWSVGWARPNAGLIVLLSENAGRAEGRELRLSQVFVHELAHLLLDAKLRGRPAPRWLEEGYSKAAAREWSLAASTTLTWAVVSGRLIPLAELLQRFPEREPAVHLAYVQSFSFTAYLLNRFGPAAFGRLLDLLAAGEPIEPACATAFGRNLYELEGDWRSYLRLHHTWLGLLAQRPSLWGLITVLFLLALAVSWRRRRRKLRRMELEEMLEDLRNAPPDDRNNWRNTVH